MNAPIVNNQQSILSVKHVGSFLLLIFLATFKPTYIWPNFPISLEPITVLAIGILLFYKIYATIGFKVFYQKYKVELLLLTAYFAICFLSLYLNRYRYANTQEIIRYGILFIVITASFPAAIFLFILPQNDKGLSLSRFKLSGYLPWVYFLLLALMAIWQYADYESSKYIGQFFVASEVWPNKNVNGFFRVSTDVAPIFAILLIAIAIYCSKLNQQRTKLFFIGICILIFLAGLSVGSRVFFLIMAIAIIIFIAKIKISLIHKIVGVIFIIISVHFMVMFANEDLIFKLQNNLPYLGPLYTGVPFKLNDFLIELSLAASGREELWILAIQFIKDSPFFGISNGAFRLANTELRNSHNIILQVLLSSGVIGISILSLLVYKLRLHILNLTVIVWLCSLMVDFPIDHSLPYIVCLSFVLVLFKLKNIKHPRQVIQGDFFSEGKVNLKWITLFISLMVLAILGIYYQRYSQLMEGNLGQRLTNQLSSRYFLQEPILIDEKRQLSIMGAKDMPLQQYNTIRNNVNYCHYRYLKKIYKINLNDNWYDFVSKIGCGHYDYRVKNTKELLMKSNYWLADIAKRKTANVWYLVKDVNFYSPVVKISSQYLNFQFLARGYSLFDEKPVIKMEFIVNKKVIETKQVTLASSDYTKYNINFDNIKELTGYFTISLVNPGYDVSTSSYRRIHIKTKSLKVFTK